MSETIRTFGILAYVLTVHTLSGTPAMADERERERSVVQQKITPSIAYLQFWTRDGEIARYGTGFVVESRDAGRSKWIITSAHSLRKSGSKPIAAVLYRLSNQETPVECGEMLLDVKHDLVAFRPNPIHPITVPAVQFYNGKLAKDQRLYALGSPYALAVIPYDGYSAGELTIAELADRQRIPLENFRPFSPDLRYLQHTITIAGGFSGCPLVTKDGKVVGLQASTLPDDQFVSFAVHQKHIQQFDWGRKPAKLIALNLEDFNVDRVLRQTAARRVVYDPEASRPPVKLPERKHASVKIRLGGIDVEAPFVHHGYVERDARTVIEKYVQDKQWYTEEKFGAMRVIRLQELLDRTPLARISNPLLGFQMLVPKGYRYSAQSTSKPDGLLVTFDPPEGREVAKPYDWPLSIWVTVEPQLFTNARDVFAKKVKSGEFKPTEGERKKPELFANFRDRYVKALVADVVDPRFALRDLGIRIQDGPNKIRGSGKSKLFAQVIAGEGAWLRSNYQSIGGSLNHLVRIGSRDPLVLVVHYQYNKEDAAAFHQLTGKPNITDLEYTILASTVSTR